VGPTADGCRLREETAAASVLLEPVFEGPDRPLRVLGRAGPALHLDTGGHTDTAVVSVTAGRAVRLPASVQLAGPLPRSVTTARAGLGRLLLGDLQVRVHRWWRPLAPGVRDPRRAAVRAATTAAALPPPEAAVGPALVPLRDAVRAGTGTGAGTGAGRAVAGLVGMGPGLTPAGDDVLAGALVSLRAVERGGHTAVGGLASDLARAAARLSTTTLSAALLQDAGRGWSVPELADFLAALDGRGELRGATSRLLAVGHSSGAALAHGAVLVLTAAEVARGCP
jgi:hypothetical protein